MITIKILGSGCANCELLKQLVQKVLDTLGVEAEMTKITDPAIYTDYGVMSTPALIINEKCHSSGRIPSLNELTQIIQTQLNEK